MAIFPQGLSNIAARCRNTEDGGAERRVLHQLNRCLEDDYLVWHNVPLGAKGRLPDFVILHPSRGLLILEVKGWHRKTLRTATRSDVVLDTARGRVSDLNPLMQARGYAVELVNLMQSDPLLCEASGPHQGKLITPWGSGAVLANIERSKITDPQWDDLFPHSRTLTREDLADDLDPAAFQERLWGMFTVTHRRTLTLPQRDRIRWHLFPELRIPTQASLLDDDVARPDIAPGDALLQVMDLQQEQLARCLGDGHRVIHGVAGSGKTMILVHRAQQLSAAVTPARPVLVLCYNRPLSARIEALLRSRGIDDRVQVRTFHSWCYEMACTYQLPLPRRGGKLDYDALVDAVIQAIDHGRIPRAQYAALLIDEGHDFEDAWLRLAPQLIDPTTNSLLVLYDDAQSIYRKPRRKFSFASVGIQAVGRTNVLKVNYRNTSEVLALAAQTAGRIVAGEDPSADDDIVHLSPQGAGRHGPLPELIMAKSAWHESQQIAAKLSAIVASGVQPSDVCVMSRRHDLLNPIEQALQSAGLSTQRLDHKAPWQPDSVKLTTLHASKGLEFHTVSVIGLQAVPDARSIEDEEWRLLYVAMTRATHELLLSACGPSAAVDRIAAALKHDTSVSLAA